MASDPEARVPRVGEPLASGYTDNRIAGWAHGDSLLIGALAWLVMVAVANTGATAVAQPALQDAFGVGPGQVGWVVFGYTAAFAISTAWYGSLAARFGAGRAISSGASVLALGALAAAFASDFSIVVGARVVQGIGAGAIPTLSFAIASERMEGRARARAIGMIVAGVGVGQALGPLLGGVLIDSISWRGAVAVGTLALPAIVLIAGLHRGGRDPAVRLDVAGALKLAVVIGGATWLLNRAPTRGLDLVVGGVLLGVVGGAVLGVVHLRRTRDAFIPMRVLVRPGFPSRVLGGALLMGVYTAVLTGIPLVAGGAERLGGVTLGLLMLPMALTLAAASTNTHRLGLASDGNAIIAVGFAALAVASVFAGMAPAADSLAMIAAALVPLGIAYALLAGPLTSHVSGLFPLLDRSVALGAYHVGFFVGGAAGGSIVAGAIDTALPAGHRGFAVVMIALAGLAAAGALTVLASSRRTVG